MSEERRQILKMLSEGKIDVSEAERLLDAIDEDREITKTIGEKKPIKIGIRRESTEASEETKPKYLRIQVEPKDNNIKGERVNIKVPIQLLRAGAKMASFIPGKAKEKVNENLKDKGINFNLSEMNGKNIEGIIDALRETSIDVDSDDEVVRIFCE